MIFIRSMVGWWTGTGWSRTIETAQEQPTEYEAKIKAHRMRKDGHRVRIHNLASREVPLNDKGVLLGDDSVKTKARLPSRSGGE